MFPSVKSAMHVPLLVQKVTKESATLAAGLVKAKTFEADEV